MTVSLANATIVLVKRPIQIDRDPATDLTGTKARHNMCVSSCIRVLIADDHAAVREGLAAIVDRQADMSVVAQAANGREAVEMFRQHQPDIALIDLRMPVMNGAAATKAIVEQFPAASILIVSMHTHDGPSLALQIGAKGFCLKDGGRVPLLTAIRSIVGARVEELLEIPGPYVPTAPIAEDQEIPLEGKSVSTSQPGTPPVELVAQQAT